MCRHSQSLFFRILTLDNIFPSLKTYVKINDLLIEFKKIKKRVLFRYTKKYSFEVYYLRISATDKRLIARFNANSARLKSISSFLCSPKRASARSFAFKARVTSIPEDCSAD